MGNNPSNHQPLERGVSRFGDVNTRRSLRSPRKMDRLRRSFRDSFRRRKDRSQLPESSRPHVWQADESAVRAGTCTFHVKYLGCVEVFESRGMQVCEEALKVLRASRRRPVKALLHVSGDGLRVVEDETKGLIVDQTIEKVSFCAPDRNHERGFSYICRDGTTRRWMAHGFLALRDSGERLSHAVGCAFSACLERKQQRDKQCAVTMTFDQQTNSFTRQGSFRTTTMTESNAERLENQKRQNQNQAPGSKPTVNPFAIERPHATPHMLERQGSFRGLGQLGNNSPFKRQMSLRVNDLPSNTERLKQFIKPVSPIPEQDSVTQLCVQLTQGLSQLTNSDDFNFNSQNSVNQNVFGDLSLKEPQNFNSGTQGTQLGSGTEGTQFGSGTQIGSGTQRGTQFGSGTQIGTQLGSGTEGTQFGTQLGSETLGTQIGTGTQRGTQFGSGTQIGSGTQRGTQFGSGTQIGTQLGSGTEGTQLGSETLGTQIGTGTQRGTQFGSGTQIGSGTQRGTQFGSGTQIGTQLGKGTGFGSGTQLGSGSGSINSLGSQNISFSTTSTSQKSIFDISGSQNVGSNLGSMEPKSLGSLESKPFGESLLRKEVLGGQKSTNSDMGTSGTQIGTGTNLGSGTQNDVLPIDFNMALNQSTPNKKENSTGSNMSKSSLDNSGTQIGTSSQIGTILENRLPNPEQWLNEIERKSPLALEGIPRRPPMLGPHSRTMSLGTAEAFGTTVRQNDPFDAEWASIAAKNDAGRGTNPFLTGTSPQAFQVRL